MNIQFKRALVLKQFIKKIGGVWSNVKRQKVILLIMYQSEFESLSVMYFYILGLYETTK